MDVHEFLHDTDTNTPTHQHTTTHVPHSEHDAPSHSYPSSHSDVGLGLGSAVGSEVGRGEGRTVGAQDGQSVPIELAVEIMKLVMLFERASSSVGISEQMLLLYRYSPWVSSWSLPSSAT